MAQPVADDGLGWNRIDKLMLWLLPPFLVYVAAKTGGDGVLRYALMLVAVVAGTAVVRGIEAALSIGRDEPGSR